MENNLLCRYENARSKNLNFFKFLAAIAVIVSHAYPLSKGEAYKDFLLNISGQSLGLGGLAVSVFFVSSGFFVTKSINKDSNIKNYFIKRIKKIFPPLWIVLIFVIVICFLFFSDVRFSSYNLGKSLLYCLNFLLIPVHSLPGVFINNAYPKVINGALWTLPIEFFCYTILAVLMFFKLFTKKNYVLFSIFTLFSFIMVNFCPIQMITLLKDYLMPIFMFFWGSFYWIYRDKIVLSKNLFIGAFILFIISIVMNIGNIGLFLFFPYILLYASFNMNQVPAFLSNLGNYSYGIYLCGWPIQQMIVSLFGGNMSIILNCVFAIPLSIICGVLIYYFVEKRMI